MTENQSISYVFIVRRHGGNEVDQSRGSEGEEGQQAGHEEVEHGFLSGEEILVPAKEYLHSVKLNYEDKRNERCIQLNERLQE